MTDGPQLTLVTVTPTPKFLRICCSLMAVSLYSLSEKPPLFLSPRFNRLMGGNTYSFFTGGAGFSAADPPDGCVCPALACSALAAPSA